MNSTEAESLFWSLHHLEELRRSAERCGFVLRHGVGSPACELFTTPVFELTGHGRKVQFDSIHNAETWIGGFVAATRASSDEVDALVDERAHARRCARVQGRLTARWYDQARGLKRDKAAETWQPIETAPKDGTSILVWAHNQSWEVRWDKYEWRDPGGDHIGDPTHWRTMPEGPR